MKKLTFLLLTFIISGYTYSQVSKETYLFKRNDKYGYVNNHFNIIVEPKYEELGGYYKNYFGRYSIFKLAGKLGVLDQKGNHIIPASFEYLSYTGSAEIFKFEKMGKSGLVNIESNEILKAEFESNIKLSDNGKLIIANKNGKYGLLNLEGKPLTDFIFDQITSNFNADIIGFGLNNRYGYLSNIGEVLIKPIFQFIRPFYDGYAIVKTGGKFGVIDKKGVFVVEPLYDDISYKYSFYQYSRIIPTSKIYYIKLGNKTGLLDKKFNLIAECIYDEIGSFNEGYAFIAIDNKFGFIDSDGKIIIPLMYENANYFSQGLAPVIKNGKWGFINSKNEVVIEFKFTGNVRPFSDGLAVYRQRRSNSSKGNFVGDKCGYINLNGDVEVEPIYKEAYDFNNGVAVIEDNESIYLIKKNMKKFKLKATEPELDILLDH